ncbi:uncharacterized protein LOC143299017 isoform X2 [Babylonia areolata]|uniref:uncharacterized protein LOC143299017 isoform X2 n=1 Tax=Babylonia areolata TaxID=304850 RepID=UPI003FD09272
MSNLPGLFSLHSAESAEDQPGSKAGVMSVTARAGLQPRVYREGMQYMRDRIAEISDDLDGIQCRYHGTEHVDHDLFVHYLQACDAHFLRANTQLRKRGVKLEVIDSETRLVSLLNRLREDDACPADTVQYLTEYWENVKDTVESLKAVLSKFQTNVLNRLKRNYISDSSGDTPLAVCSSFTADISSHMTDLESRLSNTRILLKSFHSGVHQNLFDKTPLADLLVVSCDLKAFPLLRLVADVAGKVCGMCHVAHLWLVRDEQFMLEIHSFIREARQRARRREEDLRSQKEQQKKYEKSVKAAHILLYNNRDKLHRIETELRVLEEQMNESARDKQHHYDQLQQKESMVDFLQITLSQTKRNYTLQATRVKLSRQVKDLKELLTAMELDLDAIQNEIQVKAEEKVRLSEKVEYHEKSYDALRCDMDRFSSRMEQLETEVTDLSGQLLQLEMIHNLKTSPEKVEEMYDRPSTVKLAPSLKEKIKERQRRIKPK